jgi:hypothetical protein
MRRYVGGNMSVAGHACRPRKPTSEAEKNGPERLTLPSRRAKMTRVKRFAVSGQLNNGLVQRNRAVHGRSGADHAVASDHGSFYRCPPANSTTNEMIPLCGK